MKARCARPDDLAEICRLIDDHARHGLLLPRSKEDIRAHIRRFLVLAEELPASASHSLVPVAAGKLLGCVALEPYGAGLAEIRSLAVDRHVRGRGLGTRLVEAALEAARRRRIARVFAVTHVPALFERRGFVALPRQALPEKISRDCCACPKARGCDLVAVAAAVFPERTVLPVLATAGGIAATR
jgi:N-acetylglutamate synthase-like GNAT family acetyltransferase